MNSRERLICALNFKEPDRPPIDLGATSCSGAHASIVQKMRKALSLEDKKVFVYEVLQQLGYIDEDLRKALGVDVVGLIPYANFVGDINKSGERKSYPVPQGVEGECIKEFTYRIEPDGSRDAFPQGDLSAEPSLYMPSDGCFFDNIDRSKTVIEDESDPFEDFKDCFSFMSDEELDFYEKQVRHYLNYTDYGIVSNCAFAGFGDAAFIPGASLKEPKGIRKLEDWYMISKIRPEYVHAVYKLQTECALKNLELLKQAVGNNIQAIFISGTDFGMQTGGIISRQDFVEFYKPYYKIINDWIHNNTTWKTLYHSCGSIIDFLDDMYECGVDSINPVQCSAKGMSPQILKEKYGKKFVFWGAGIDTQKVLPFGTVEECRRMARERIDIFSKGGGYVFAAIHNVQAKSPIENVLAVYQEANQTV